MAPTACSPCVRLAALHESAGTWPGTTRSSLVRQNPCKQEGADERICSSPGPLLPGVDLQTRPLQSGDVLQGLAGFRQRAVKLKRLVVEKLPHGQVGELLHQLEGVRDVEEHGEEVFSVPGAHTDALGKHQRGVLL